jgi:beta-glucosidase
MKSLFKKRARHSWDWNTIPIDDFKKISLKKDFLWGSGSCEYQVSGASNCSSTNWAAWEKEQKNGIKHNQRSGNSADHWNRYKEDIQLMKALHLNAYRFSLDWGKIEPLEGIYNDEAIQHYIDVCQELINNNITPMITLFHFVCPVWFEKKGGFEKEENIEYFIRFSKKMFFVLEKQVKLWCIINEPSVYTLMGYIFGDYPPGKKSFYLAGVVLKNLLKAHCDVYQLLKSTPQGKKAEFGIVYSSLKTFPRHRLNILIYLFCCYFNYIKNGAFLNFFKTGRFNWITPLGKKVSYTCKVAPNCIDFFGLNYYSRVVVRFKDIFCKTGSCYPDEIMTDMPFAIHAEGLYDAIQEASEFRLPIYITENGIADSRDDRRELFIRRHLYVMSKAIEDGFDVRGYFYWSLTDNFEWTDGFLMNFGLYHVNFSTQERTLRLGALCYKQIIINSIEANP